ncbi:MULTISPECIES: hypothetical protein [Pseudomonas syringae group]|uniref:hypothetical protein n=1 Tax=Pseudomonas syringae group TaxID=136849 RepID=UPI000F0040BF|nr:MULTISPECIES: hypothetical protein [Pseudomonas syringae group]MCF5712455.1 hypothetical protein [Pseudomonas tremae]MCF5745223.1 hypothetical protein [Pseudomonas tremae]RMP33627.1 hypothetical protein ALQ25_00924 [Pseudomonas coronafaciens pv. atropurpurea]UQB32563.1 hypothetical protein I9H06_04590 [Pseudomonas tremae]UQB35774.1 hypothetical protein I9H09_19885 [Pseudomonas tremae]
MALDWPESLEPTETAWGVTYNNQAFTSTLSNAQQVVGYPGAYWMCTMTFGVLFDEDERQLTSLIGRLQGMFGTVRIPAFTRTRQDDIGAAVVVSSAAQATLMIIGGVTPSTKVFSTGDYITVGGEMFEVVQDASSTAQGRVQVSLNKRIRRALTAGTPVEYRNPYSEMRRVVDTHQVVIQPVVSNSTLQFREAF